MQETALGFRAEIPAKRRKTAVIFAGIFAAFSGGFGVLYAQRSADEYKLLFVLIPLFMTLFGIFVLVNEIFGTETIELNGSSLQVWDSVFGFRRRRNFDITLIQNLRMGSSTYWQGNTYVMSEGRIQFDYEGSMVSIGGNVSDEEAFKIVDSIRSQRTPQNIGA